MGLKNRVGIRDTTNIEGGSAGYGIKYLGGIGMHSCQLVGCGIVLELIAGCGI